MHSFKQKQVAEFIDQFERFKVRRLDSMPCIHLHPNIPQNCHKVGGLCSRLDIPLNPCKSRTGSAQDSDSTVDRWILESCSIRIHNPDSISFHRRLVRKRSGRYDNTVCIQCWKSSRSRTGTSIDCNCSHQWKSRNSQLRSE